MTTAFLADGGVDHAFVARHARWQVENGCKGVVALGSLGESATLRFEEKAAVLRTLVEALGDSAPVVAGVAALSTREAVALAREAKAAGCQGLMVLPPYVYSTDWREMKAHVAAVIAATDLSCMLYNNPVAYKTDFLTAHIRELAAEHDNLHAVKESSGDVRRVTALRAECGERLSILVGVDDMIVEGVAAGATGWVAGLVNAFPKESVALFDLAIRGEVQAAARLNAWFLPLLRMDMLPKFVQLIKLVQQEIGMGSERVRAPRLALEGLEREAALTTIREAMATQPGV